MEIKSNRENSQISEIDKLTEKVIAAAIEVHKHLGAGLLESVYKRYLAYELSIRETSLTEEKTIPFQYKELSFDNDFRADMSKEDRLILELKSVAEILPVHEAQIISYMKLSGIRQGLLINFNVPILIKGLKRYNIR